MGAQSKDMHLSWGPVQGVAGDSSWQGDLSNYVLKDTFLNSQELRSATHTCVLEASQAITHDRKVCCCQAMFERQCIGWAYWGHFSMGRSRALSSPCLQSSTSWAPVPRVLLGLSPWQAPL